MKYTPPSGDAADFALQTYTVPSGDVADFELGSLFVLVPGWGIRGKIGAGPKQTTDNTGTNGIWQMRMTKRGKVPVKMKFYKQLAPYTETQLATQTKFAAAMAAWVALTPTQKAAYTERAKKRQMFGWGLFIREYYQTH